MSLPPAYTTSSDYDERVIFSDPDPSASSPLIPDFLKYLQHHSSPTLHSSYDYSAYNQAAVQPTVQASVFRVPSSIQSIVPQVCLHAHMYQSDADDEQSEEWIDFTNDITSDFSEGTTRGWKPEESFEPKYEPSSLLPIPQFLDGQIDPPYLSYKGLEALSHSNHRTLQALVPQGVPNEEATPIKSQIATDALVKASCLRRKNPMKKGRHVCPLCDRDFTAAHNLKNHINSHLGRRLFRCEHCNRRFGTGHVLKRHVLKRHIMGVAFN
ncbi:hypothetical protein VKT23_009092 [Stygiomarasmius scandens]|uniref:C2H2-type domain-containing protein n=1 Tax=Marasmiellus scandens TaxID=2682957 RepID=A0ABR1JGY6_9AGAR